MRSKSSNKISDLVTLLETSANFIINSKLYLDEDRFQTFLKNMKNLDSSIDGVQLLTESGFYYLNGARYDAQSYSTYDKNIRRVLNKLPQHREWYMKTKNELKTTVSVVNVHQFFKEQTINICTPILSETEYLGGLCIVSRSRLIIDKLQLLLPRGTTDFFILTNDGTCFSQPKDEEFSDVVKPDILALELSENETKYLQVGKKSISVALLEPFEWMIVVITDNFVYEKSLGILMRNSIYILLAFLALIIFANIAHESIRFALNKKYNHVKRLTQLWLKDSSRGLVLYDSLKRISFTNQKAKRLLKLIYATHGNMYIDNLLKFTPTKETLHVKDRFYEVVVNPLNDGTLFEGWVLRITDTTKEKELEKQKNEYEQLLAHQGKMVEIGELIGGINHQLKQPITSANLFISNILQQHEHNILKDSTLVNNLLYCQKSLMMMNETIDIYKNYYKTNSTCSEFDIKVCLQKVVKILEEKICRHNVKVKIECEDGVSINSKENIIQQIILVLLNNAIDSAKESNDKNVIIGFIQKDEFANIQVSDFGKGLSEEAAKNLFKQIVDTKKEKGTGLGLYFANKLATKKIDGYIKVAQNQSPTIFELVFKLEDIG